MLCGHALRCSGKGLLPAGLLVPNLRCLEFAYQRLTWPMLSALALTALATPLLQGRALHTDFRVFPYSCEYAANVAKGR
jgi:hypothetical protein